ncbi:MAG: extracellular solute-binding protein [Propionicimonas sp.]|uniref:ABC transporter substrate-binding protein n=1 Tax=Propionicimonas sp. TaxID=1955623 RepID=UPI002B1F9FD4|nr:extracellular solute-binding protein [Propionicimonas sp.]MEA4943391.1 extracellular solute-binding protein [Propionicimonas sp.]MEA5052596.1 extracellular solute-binding protein [Propionicimonas sp.]MEA5116005.1 extracellular solute-binding protein [Propionicimonas sp.]
MTTFRTALLAAGAAAALVLTGCSGSPAESGTDSTTLTFWHYEDDTSAMAQSWQAAIADFEKENPGVTVKVEKQTFEQLQKNAKIVLSGDTVPDVMEYNKGNGTAGQLASQGLLADLTDSASQLGWDQKLPGSLQTTARYDENGLMGSGNWYGVPTYGEFVQIYLNNDMFAENGIAVPTDQASLISAMDAFVAKGITPIATAGAEYPLAQLWSELVLSRTDRSFVDAYQLFKGDVSWTDGPLAEGTKELADWVAKGYVAKSASGLKAEDMAVGFISGKYPMMVSGSWWFGRLQSDVKFDMGQVLFPGSGYSSGSSGNLLVVPTNAKNKDLAIKFINDALGENAQNVAAVKGGLPVAGDASKITDPQTKQLTENWQTLVGRDGLSFYMDWPVAGFYDKLVSFCQTVMNGSKDPMAALAELGEFYESGKKDIVGG